MTERTKWDQWAGQSGAGQATAWHGRAGLGRVGHMFIGCLVYV